MNSLGWLWVDERPSDRCWFCAGFICFVVTIAFRLGWSSSHKAWAK